MANIQRYFKSGSPNEKYDVSKEIVDSIHSCGGRFLNRGNRCWVAIDSSEARTKVAQAIQYQRRKQLKLGNSSKCRNGGSTDFSTTACPQPPVLLRQKHFSPNGAAFDTPLKDHLSRIGDASCGTSPVQQLARFGVKSPKQRNKGSSSNIASSSFLKKQSIATDGATIVAPYEKLAYSLTLNSLNHMMTNSHSSNHETNACNPNFNKREGSHWINKETKQQQIESSIPMTINCVFD